MEIENKVVTPEGQAPDEKTEKPLNIEGINQIVNENPEGSVVIPPKKEESIVAIEPVIEEEPIIEEDHIKLVKENEDLKKEIEEKNVQLTASQTEALRLKHDNEEKIDHNLAQEDVLATLQREKEDDVLGIFWNNHQDVLPKDSLNKLKEARLSGDNELIVNDPILSRLNSALQNLIIKNPSNPLADFNQRLEKALRQEFSGELVELAKKQSQVKTELALKETEKLVIPEGGSGDRKVNPAYTPAQIEAAEKMGVKLP